MSLGAPFGLLALAALAPLLAAYFLRRKQPPRVVSALFLWRTPDQRAEAGPRFERFSRELSLLFESLAVVAAALFLADARCGQSAPRQHVVVVVDGSLSLLARQGSGTTADLVRDAVAKLAREENAGVLTIVESGVKPRLLAGPQVEVAKALSLLEAWRPAQPAHDVTPALVMARELGTSERQRIHFFTDGPLPTSLALPPQVQVRGVGRAQDNLAFLSAQRHDEGGLAVVTVRVGNFADQPRPATVRFVAVDGAAQPESQQLQLPAGGSSVLRVAMRTAGPIEAHLPDDALPEDGHIRLLPSPTAEVTVALLPGLDEAAKAALVHFLAIAPSVKVVADGALTVGPPGAAARVTVGAKGTPHSFVGPFFALKSHPVLDDVGLGGAVWTAGENPAGRALLSAGEVVLLSEDDDGALHFNLDVGRSNVQRTVAWPVLWGNVVRQARLGVPGLPRKHLMLGEEVPLVTATGAAWTLRGPGGRERPVLGVGPLTLPAPDAPGTWTLLRDGQPFDALEVLPLDPRESDLRSRGPVKLDAQVGEGLASLATTTPRAVWPLVLLLVVLLLDFWLTARRAHA